MDNASPFQAAWQWRKFATCHLLALLLLILWLWGPTRELMNGFDFWLFDKLNGSLALNETWLKLWGLLSTRPFDAVVGVILLCLLIRGDWLLPANQVRRLTFGFIVTLLILVVIRVLYAKIAHHLHWQHASLSMLMDKAIHLSDHFPDWERVWEIKDRSKRSFPGDHASVLLVWALFMSLFARRAGQFLLIWTLAVLFMMPRLVAGAHWGQDDYIGGLQMALLALAWGCYTPLAAKASGWLVQVTEPLFRLLAKLPLIGRLGVVRDSAGLPCGRPALLSPGRRATGGSAAAASCSAAPLSVRPAPRPCAWPPRARGLPRCPRFPRREPGPPARHAGLRKAREWSRFARRSPYEWSTPPLPWVPCSACTARPGNAPCRPLSRPWPAPGS